MQVTDHDRQKAYETLSGGAVAARGIAALLVVLVHVNLVIRPALEDWWPGGFWCAPLFGLPVPLFFMLSGYSSVFGTAGNSRRRSLWHPLQRLVFPFFTWNCILLVIDSRMSLSPGEWLFSFLTGTWQLYFLFVLIQLQLLMHLLSRARTPPSPRRLFMFSAILTLVFFVATDLALWTWGAQAGFVETHLIQTIMPWIVFYAGGVLLRHEPELIRQCSRRLGTLTVFTLVAYLIYVAELRREAAWLGFNPVLQFLLSGLFFQAGGVVLILLLLQHRPGQPAANLFRPLFSAIGKEAYGIFLAHTSVLLLILAVYNQSSVQFAFQLEPPLLWLASLLGAWGLVKASRHLPWSWPGFLLFGIRLRKRDVQSRTISITDAD